MSTKPAQSNDVSGSLPLAQIERRYNDNNELLQESVYLTQKAIKRLDMIRASYRCEVIPLYSNLDEIAELKNQIKQLRSALEVLEEHWALGNIELVTICKNALLNSKNIV